MDKKINTTDLHIQHHMETGEWFQWDSSKYNNSNFHGEDGYTYDYTRWLEEKYINLLNNHVNQKEIIEKMGEELENLAELNNNLNEEIYDLEESIKDAEEERRFNNQ
jgi:hypothetical protein